MAKIPHYAIYWSFFVDFLAYGFAYKSKVSLDTTDYAIQYVDYLITSIGNKTAIAPSLNIETISGLWNIFKMWNEVAPFVSIAVLVISYLWLEPKERDMSIVFLAVVGIEIGFICGIILGAYYISSNFVIGLIFLTIFVLYNGTIMRFLSIFK